MSSVKVEVIGAKEAQEFLNKKRKRVDNKLIPQGIKNATFFLQGEVKQSIAGRRAETRSVDTGQLLNSVQGQPGKDDGIVFSQVKHARPIEFGTSRFTGRKHFRNSAARNKAKIMKILDDSIKNI